MIHKALPGVRSIPACAGEPCSRPASNPWLKVYPRVCGGTAFSGGRSSAYLGLSPRVRGNRLTASPKTWETRSIPACAGEPSSAGRHRRAARVYPRVCGGTVAKAGGSIPARGLSPRVRGNRRNLLPDVMRCRSIPACAGEPSSGRCAASAPRVYPRVCGGTDVTDLILHLAAGLSPRVRGNLRSGCCPDSTHRSIPACAGEP